MTSSGLINYRRVNKINDRCGGRAPATDHNEPEERKEGDAPARQRPVHYRIMRNSHFSHSTRRHGKSDKNYSWTRHLRERGQREL